MVARVLKAFAKFYIAQALAGAAIGFAIPFIRLFLGAAQ